MSARGHLKLVPYNPEDYSLGDVLGEADGTTLREHDRVSSCLSLYFQWEEYRTARIYPADPKNTKPLHCELDYDRDERSPTELWVRLTDASAVKQFTEFETAYVRFEVFRTCYEFKAKVVARFDDPAETPIHLVLTIPTELKVYKSRRLPRTQIDPSTVENLPPASWHASSSGPAIPLELTEIGLRSTRVRHSAPLLGPEGKLRLGDSSFSARIAKTEGDSSILILELSTAAEFGQYFDIYRTIVYPFLKSRYEVPFEKGIQLYEDANYFGKFAKGDLDAAKRELPALWDDIRSGFHETTADYYIVDDDEAPSGSSSLALAFYSGDTPVWVMHQTCALKKPELITRSGALYTWRAEYLAARNENLQACVTFDSKSRWLERIYVKFASRNEQKSKMYPARFIRTRFTTDTTNLSGPSETPIETRTYNIGSRRRISTTSTHIWAAAAPQYLSATEGLNEVISAWQDPDVNELKAIGATLARSQNLTSIVLRVVCPPESNLGDIEGVQLVSDRVCTFEKESLTELLNSIDHSVAVTKRKVLNEE